MKKIILLVFILSLALATSDPPQVGLSLRDDLADISLRQTFSFSDYQKASIEAALSVWQQPGVYLNVRFIQKMWDQNWVAGISYLGTDVTAMEWFGGWQIPFRKGQFSLGAKFVQTRLIPFIWFHYDLGNFKPFIQLSDRIKLGLHYGFGPSNDEIRDFFRVITPVSGAESRQDSLVIKGYYLDRGRLFLDGQEVTLRPDGMFIETVTLPRYGKNKFRFVLRGKNISYYEQDFLVYRLFPFADLSPEIQKQWEDVVNLIGFPKGDKFLPEKAMTRAQFYLYLAQMVQLEKKAYAFPDLFIDVHDDVLRDNLNTFYGKGILKQAYKEFFPDQVIKREEAFTVLSRFLGEPPTDNAVLFFDVSSRNWVYEPAKKLVNWNLIPDDFVHPREPLTREAFFNIAAPFMRLLEPKVRHVEQMNVAAMHNVVMEDSGPTVPMLEKAQHEYTFADIELIQPVGDIRQIEDTFFVKGYGPPGLQLWVNESMVMINRRGRFAESMSLKPGMNKLRLRLNQETRDYVILRLKKFDDLDENETYTDVIEKVCTILNYRLQEPFFGAGDELTREAFVSLLVDLNYLAPKRLKTLKDKEKPMITKEAISVLNSEAGTNLQFNQTFEPVLTRRDLVRLLAEIPSVREAMNRFYKF